MKDFQWQCGNGPKRAEGETGKQSRVARRGTEREPKVRKRRNEGKQKIISYFSQRGESTDER